MRSNEQRIKSCERQTTICNSDVMREQRDITKTSPQLFCCGEVYYLVSNIRASDLQQREPYLLHFLHIS